MKDPGEMDVVSIAQDKKKYGVLLPKSGVYFLPDERIVVFLKIMRSLVAKSEKGQNYNMINKYKGLLDKFRTGEEQRQLHNMKVAQLKELANIETA